MQNSAPHLASDETASLCEALAEARATCSALRTEVERLKLLIDNAPVLLAYLDREHRYQFVNTAYYRRFGDATAQMVGQPAAAVLGEPLWSRIKAHREKVLTGEPVEYEVDVEHVPGNPQHMHVALNPARNAEGDVVGYVAAITDVTDRKRVAEARDLLAAIVESSEDAIVSKTLDGRVTSWNRGAERLFGYAAEEMIGKTVPEELQAEEKAVLERITRGERVARYETVRYAKDGRRLDVAVSTAPMHDHTGRIVGIANVARDISEAKAYERAVRRSEEALREADRRKDEFLALLAHELRNPLAPLVNALELLRPEADQNPALRRIRDMMERQLSQLERLVDDLLDVSRISRGRFELRRAPVGLALAIESAVEACQIHIASRGHTLTVEQSPEPLMVEGDFARLAQVFANLISNSIKYTEPGGRIWVSVAREGDEAVVTVRDTGLGIPPESLDLIFDMFSQVQAHKRHAGGGLGLGLALVRSLVKMHGGTVHAFSEGVGKGSTFTVRLPLLQLPAAEQASAPHPAALPLVGQQKRRILVADDNADAAASLAMILQMQGHETRTASDGSQAVEIAATFQPDIIFMDVGMPRVDGLEATRRIRAQPWGKNMLIVALTGWGQQSDRRQTSQVGMDLHLVKPINLEGIAAVLAHS
ncbi:MAG: PAS domain S-box protein [Steroidobacteraceae bacterium]|nr:PAS domain S-box protein [Steroidobacteraceae bacterium]